MNSIEERLADLIRRSSRDAWLYLQQLRDHPQFPELLVHLEKMDGTLLEKDIQQALRLFMRHPKRD